MLQVALRTVALLAEGLKRLHGDTSLCEASFSVILRAEGVTVALRTVALMAWSVSKSTPVWKGKCKDLLMFKL